MDTSSGNTRKTQQVIRPSIFKPNFISEELYYHDSEHESQDIDNYVDWDPSEDENAVSIRLAAIDTENPVFPPRLQEIPEAAQGPVDQCQYQPLWRVNGNHNDNALNDYQNFLQKPSVKPATAVINVNTKKSINLPYIIIPRINAKFMINTFHHKL